MPKTKDTLVRAYALEILVPLSGQPRINKEKLFADAVAYYRWLLADAQAMEALDVYWNEFRAHHKTLLARMGSDERVACFITWFVEQEFHKQAPLNRTLTKEEYLRVKTEKISFSSPSFRLPTGDPVESYLVQWLYWHLDNLHESGAETDQALIAHWAEGMISELLEEHQLSDDESAAFRTHAAHFFAWSRKHLRTWDMFMGLFVVFLKDELGQAIDQSDTPLADACFVHWFCQHSHLCPVQESSMPASIQDQRVSADE